jgi:YD repeat-containing protein
MASPPHENQQPFAPVWDQICNRTRLDTWFGRITFGYDPRSSINLMWDPRGGRTTYTLNALGRLSEQVSPDGCIATWALDAAGRLLEVRNHDAAGNTLGLALMAHDAVGNPTLKATRTAGTR